MGRLLSLLLDQFSQTGFALFDAALQIFFVRFKSFYFVGTAFLFFAQTVCYFRPEKQLVHYKLRHSNKGHKCHPPAISTVFPISRILYFISIGSILNIRRLVFYTPSKSQAKAYSIGLSFLSLNVYLV